MPPRRRGEKRGGVSTRKTRQTEPSVDESVHDTERDSRPHQMDPNLRTAVIDEVMQTLQDLLPHIISETKDAIAAETKRSDSSKSEKYKKRKRDVEDEESEGNESSEFEEEEQKGCDYKFFKTCSPPSFDGNRVATDAQQWLREIEAVIEISGCRNDQKVLFASHSFVSEAHCWWDNIKTALGEKATKKMEWKKFKKMVIEEFCTKVELDAIEKDFLNFEAGDLSHREYTTKFNQMARMCPELVIPEEKKIKRYIQGLPPKVRKVVKVCKPTTYKSAVSLSATLFGDDTKKSSGKTDIGKKKNDEKGKIEQQDKRTKSDAPKECAKCKRAHFGECRYKDTTCYKCGSKEHLVSNCPKGKCFICGEVGHKANDCPKKKDKEKGKKGDTAQPRLYFVGTKK